MQKLNKYMDTLSKDAVGKGLYAEVRDVLDVYIYDSYDFLCIPKEQWEDVACSIIDYLLGKKFDIKYFIGSFRGKLNGVIRSFLLEKIKEQNAVAFDNLIIKIKFQRLKKEMIALRFLRELEFLNISFNEDIYNFLIHKSLEFRNLISSLNLSDYSYKSFMNFFDKEIPIEQPKTPVAPKKNRKRTLISENQEIKLREEPICAKGLYDRFNDYSYIMQEEKELIINYLISLLSTYRINLVKYCCQGLLYSNDTRRANLIIGNLKVQYNTFLRTGYLPIDNEDLLKLYKKILKRKRESLQKEEQDNNDYCFGMLNLRLAPENIEFLKIQFKELEVQFEEKGYSKRDFYRKVQDIIEVLKYFIINTEEEYIKMLIDMINSEINNIKRV